MGRQSSRLYYNGKDHKDIYYNGKYHNAMYFKDQGGIIWQKLPGSTTISACCVNTNNKSYDNLGVNTLYPVGIELNASIVSTLGGSNIFDAVVGGKERAFGFVSSNYRSLVWVSDDGMRWKKIYTYYEVRYVYPCIDGFIYLDSQNNVYKVTIDEDNNKVSEVTLYENLSVPSNTGKYGKYKSHNGIWATNNGKVQFLNKGGVLIEYDFGNESSISIDFTFESLSKNYAYLSGSIYDVELGIATMQNAIVSCDETEIILEAITGSEVTADKYWIKNALNIVENGNEFYVYQNINNALQISKTSDFINHTVVSEWTEEDYIQLNLVGNPVNDYQGTPINVVRFYPYNYDAQEQSNLYYDTDGNILNVRWNLLFQDKYVSFTGITLNEYGIFMEASKYYTVIGTLSRIAIWLDNPIITKETTGFAYFTDNIGVGVSYP